jgi:hypothetical protein
MNRTGRLSVPTVWFVVSISLFAAGCGSGTATVSGTVTYEGKPVKSGSVILYCADKQIVRGLIVDGQYSIPNVPCGSALATVQAHPKVPAGLRLNQKLPPSVDGPIPTPVETDNSQAVAIPPRYALPEESGLVLKVDGTQMTYEIDLKP